MALLDDPRVKMALILAGGFGLLAISIYLMFFPKGSLDQPTPRRAQSVAELINTPITQMPPLLQNPEAGIILTPGRSECEDALIHYNGALRSHPGLAADIKASARAAGCGWAQ